MSNLRKIDATIVDTGGRSNLVGIFGEQLAADVKNDILAQFSYGKSRFDLKTEVVANGGTVAITSDNLLTASTSTASNGSAYIESYNSIRYRPGHTVISHFTAMFSDIEATDTHQWIGINDGTNGFALGSHDGVPHVMQIRDGVHTHTAHTSWNGVVSESEVNWDKINVFRITFGYLGVAPAIFEILDPSNGSFRTLHTLYFHNASTETHIQLPYLPISMKVENDGNTSDVKIFSASWQGGVMGTCQDCGSRGFAFPYSAGEAQIRTAVGTTPVILAGFKNVATFNDFSNKIRAVMKKFSYVPYDASLDTLVTVQLISGATVTNGTYADIEANESVLQVNDTATTYTGGRTGLTLYSTATAAQGNTPPQSTDGDLNAEALGLFLDPTKEFVIIAFTQAGTVDIAWNVNWQELF